jgi:hypothetical protein|nr:MAG TPA: hypothetical protein [Caudoviricetes sp.]
MFRIIKIDGTELGITDSVNYIKIGESGDYATASEQDAIGIAFNSEPYNLLGHEDIEGADTVIVSNVNGGNMVYEQRNLIDELIIAALEV